MPGWTVVTEKTTLAKPITDRRRPGHPGGHRRSRGPRPPAACNPGSSTSSRSPPDPLPTNTSKLTFKAIQTYSDGTTVRWIQQTVKGAPEPEHPAPTLSLTKANKSQD